jgi:hypothetical protein
MRSERYEKADKDDNLRQKRVEFIKGGRLGGREGRQNKVRKRMDVSSAIAICNTCLGEWGLWFKVKPFNIHGLINSSGVNSKD